MPDDPVDEFFERARTKLVPKLRNSSLTVSMLSPGAFDDPKFAMELGYSILLGKPLIIVVLPGVEVPVKLAAFADHIVDADPSVPGWQFALSEKIRAILGKHLDA